MSEFDFFQVFSPQYFLVQVVYDEKILISSHSKALPNYHYALERD
jgi:hypothetical protein